MSVEYIRDKSGRIMGMTTPDSNGGHLVQDPYGRVLGKYDKQTDTTRDLYGRIISRGDTSLGLIYKDN